MTCGGKLVVSVSGELTKLKFLNGGETKGGQILTMPNKNSVYGGFSVSVSFPARTMIAEHWIYSIVEEENDY